MSSQSRPSDVGPHRSPNIGRVRCNMQGCATCRVRKKLCPGPGPSGDGDCESCLALRIECLRLYYQPVPREYRTPEVRHQLTKWHRERGTRQPHEELSLTKYVRQRSATEGSDYPAPPHFAHHHHNLSHFNPALHAYDQPARVLPLMYNSPTPLGSHLSEGSPPPDGLSELGDSSHALDAGGDSPSPAVNYSAGLVDTNDLFYGADTPTSQVWTQTIFSWPGIETGAFGGLETGHYGIDDLRNAPDPAALGFPYNPTLPVILGPEDRIAYSNLADPLVAGAFVGRNHYEAGPSMQRPMRDLAPARPMVAGSPNLLQPPMPTYRRRTESGPVGITHHQDPRVAQGEGSHSPHLSRPRRPQAPGNYGSYDTSEYLSG